MIISFFRKIWWSIYSPEFYSQVLTKGRGKAFGYFFILISILTLISAVPPIYGLATGFQPEIKKILSQASSKYPTELEVKIKNGTVTTNVSEPYFIQSPSNNKQKENYNLAVIDTTTPFSVTQFDNYKSYVWISKDAIYTKSQGNELKVYSLSKVEDLTVNKKMIDSLYSKITPWLVVVVPILSVFLIIGLFIGYTFRLVYLFFLALCIFLLAKVLKRQLSYGDSYTIGIYAMTLSLLIGIVQFYIRELHIPFLFTIVALVVVAINLRTIPTKKLASKKK